MAHEVERYEKLIIIQGMSAEQLRDALVRLPTYCGLPILPAGVEVQIVWLRPERIEPEIEDEP